MGTNYYVEKTPCCQYCGHQRPAKHIGLSSAGWRFVFRAYPDEGLTSAKAWFEYLEGKRIVDEYGYERTPPWLKAQIESKLDGQVWHSERKTIDADGHPIADYEFS